MVYTLEQKVDIILRYITSDNPVEIDRLTAMAAEALQSGKTSVYNTPDTDTAILELLKEVGISERLSGHLGLLYAISLVISDKSYAWNMGKLYAAVGEARGTTGERVSRVIRGAIESAFNKNGPGHMREIFGNTIHCDKGKPLNQEFIVTCANEVLRRTGKPIIV